MIVDLTVLGKRPQKFEFSHAPEEIHLESNEVALKSAVSAEVLVTNRIAEIDLEGRFWATVEIECARCLQKIERNLEASFVDVFVTAENMSEEKEVELKAQDLDVAVLETGQIDLKEIVREQILLNLPEQVFCQENCQGLCPHCGANRNLINCSCLDKETDPRWAALKDFRF